MKSLKDVLEETCRNCRHWLNEDGKRGVCYRYPPVVGNMRPDTETSDWCGEFEHEPREETEDRSNDSSS